MYNTHGWATRLKCVFYIIPTVSDVIVEFLVQITVVVGL